MKERKCLRSGICIDASWTPPSGCVLGMPHWEEAPRKTQDTLEATMSRLAWEHRGILLEEMEDLSGGASLLRLLTQHRYVEEDGWMDNFNILYLYVLGFFNVQINTSANQFPTFYSAVSGWFRNVTETLELLQSTRQLVKHI